MSGTDRRLHVYQNGYRSVVQLSNSRASSTSPESIPSRLSRHMTSFAKAAVGAVGEPGEVWEAAPRSPCSITFLEPTFRSVESDRAAEGTHLSPLPRRPSEEVNARWLSVSELLGQRAEVCEGRKPHTLQTSTSCAATHSAQGVSPSPQPDHTCSNSLASALAPLTVSDVRLTRSGAQTAVDEGVCDEHLGCQASGTASHADCLTPTSSVLVSFEVSCISCSPGEQERAAQRPHSYAQQAKRRDETHWSNQPSSTTASPAASDAALAQGKDRSTVNDKENEEGRGSVAHRAMSRRSGEVSIAERVLFQGGDEEDTDREEQEERCVDQDSGCDVHSAHTGSQLSVGHLRRPLASGTAPLCGEVFQAHTPPRPTSTQRDSKPDEGEHTPQTNSTVGGSVTSNAVGSALVSTPVPGELSSISCAAEHVAREASGQRRAAPTSNSSHTRTANTTALSSTAANLSSITSLCDAEADKSSDSAKLHEKQPVAALRGKGGGDVCSDACARDVLAPSARSAKTMPSDVDVHSVTPTAAATTTPEESPATPTPDRRELLYQLLAQAVSATVHTPCTRSLSSASGGAAAASPQTPTPHPTRRLGGSASSWEGLAQITGFPTPVKLSPIPTKAYALYAELTASPAASGRESERDGGGEGSSAADAASVSVMPCTPPGPLPSPALSAIECEEPLKAGLRPSFSNCASKEETNAKGLEVLHRTTGGSIADAVAASHLAHDVGKDSTNVDSEAARVASADVPCPVSCSTSSECSVSPIRTRADETTRVWTPHASDVTPGRLLQPPHSSPSCITSPSNEAPMHLGAAHPRHLSYHHQSSREAADVQRTALRGGEDDSETEATESYTRQAEETMPRTESLSPAPPATAVASTSFSREVQELQLMVQSDGVALHKTLDPLLSGRVSPRFNTDTLNLGTPTVSVIHSPAQACNESCSFLLPPTAAAYIQALPIPGMRGSSRATAATKELHSGTRRSDTVRSVDNNSSTVADGLWLSVTERHASLPTSAWPHRTPLLSPVFEDAAVTASSAAGLNATVDKGRTRPPPPSPSAPATAGSGALMHTGTNSLLASMTRKHQETQTDCYAAGTSFIPLTSPVEDDVEGPQRVGLTPPPSPKDFSVYDPRRERRAVKQAAAPLWSSLESVPPSAGHSSHSAADSHRYQRFGLSLDSEGLCRNTESRVEERRAVAMKSLSKTRVIDTWL